MRFFQDNQKKSECLEQRRIESTLHGKVIYWTTCSILFVNHDSACVKEMHYNVYMYNEQFKPFLYLVMSVIYNSSVNK